MRFDLSRRHFNTAAASVLLPLSLPHASSLAQDASSRAVASAPAAAAGGVWQKLKTEAFRGKQDDIFFVSPDVGWYGNGLGKLFQTVDGGATWNQIAHMPGTFIRALGFVDEKVGFMGNVGTEYYPDVTDTHALYKTMDGGKTWSKVQADGIEKVKGICGIHILPRQRIFQGEMREVSVIHAAGRVGGPAYVLRSLDGGAQWTVLNLSEQAGFILDVHFFDEMNGLVCSNAAMGEGKTQAQMLRTSDGGKTWASVYRSGRNTENCWKMSFPSARVGYATVQSYDTDPSADQRVVIKTTDAGRTWTELPLVKDIQAREFGIGFASETVGWVGTMNAGYETRDGGKTWTPVSFGRAVNKIRVVRAGDKARAFAIGADVHRLDMG